MFIYEKEIKKLVDQLFIDRDRLSSSGLKIYNRLRKKLNLETTEEIDNNLQLLSKKFSHKKIKQMLDNKESDQFFIELEKVRKEERK